MSLDRLELLEVRLGSGKVYLCLVRSEGNGTGLRMRGFHPHGPHA